MFYGAKNLAPFPKGVTNSCWFQKCFVGLKGKWLNLDSIDFASKMAILLFSFSFLASKLCYFHFNDMYTPHLSLSLVHSGSSGGSFRIWLRSTS